MELTVKKVEQDTTTILSMHGTLDISTSNVVEQYLTDIKGITMLILDFSNVSFIDSTGIGAIINAVYISQERNFKIKLDGVDEFIDQVFETVGLYQIIEAIQGEVA